MQGKHPDRLICKSPRSAPRCGHSVRISPNRRAGTAPRCAHQRGRGPTLPRTAMLPLPLAALGGRGARICQLARHRRDGAPRAVSSRVGTPPARPSRYSERSARRFAQVVARRPVCCHGSVLSPAPSVPAALHRRQAIPRGLAGDEGNGAWMPGCRAIGAGTRAEGRHPGAPGATACGHRRHRSLAGGWDALGAAVGATAAFALAVVARKRADWLLSSASCAWRERTRPRKLTK